jgi:hypothetical protein
MSDLRRLERTPGVGNMRLSWLENGEQKAVQAAILDSSSTGMRLKLTVAVPARTLLSVQDSKSPARSGYASVRYCRSNRMHFEIGVEFTSALPTPKSAR